MVYGYLQESKQFDKYMADWAVAYSKQVEQDYEAFVKYLRGE